MPIKSNTLNVTLFTRATEQLKPDELFAPPFPAKQAHRIPHGSKRKPAAVW